MYIYSVYNDNNIYIYGHIGSFPQVEQKYNMIETTTSYCIPPNHGISHGLSMFLKRFFSWFQCICHSCRVSKCYDDSSTGHFRDLTPSLLNPCIWTQSKSQHTPTAEITKRNQQRGRHHQGATPRVNITTKLIQLTFRKSDVSEWEPPCL